LAALAPVCSCHQEFKGKVLADAVEALIGASYLAASAPWGPCRDGSGPSCGLGPAAPLAPLAGQDGAATALPLDAAALARAHALCCRLGVLPPPPSAGQAPNPASVCCGLPLPEPPRSTCGGAGGGGGGGSGSGVATTAAAAAARRLQAAPELQALLGDYVFNQPGLLLQAFTHVSVPGAESYQRLEFLGGES
jgi:hypothetical protein